MVSFNSGSLFNSLGLSSAGYGANSATPSIFASSNGATTQNLLGFGSQYDGFTPSTANPLGLTSGNSLASLGSGMVPFASQLTSIGATTPTPAPTTTAATATPSANSALATILPALIQLVSMLIQNKQATATNPANTATAAPASADEDRGANGAGKGAKAHQKPEPTPTPTPPAPAPTPPAPAPTSPAPTPASPAPAAVEDASKVKTDKVNGGGPNELVLKNTDSKPMTIALFENTGPGMNPNIDNPNNQVTVQPGQTLKLAMPESWQGRAQKLSGKANDDATWAEINFEKGQNGASNKIWYDESLIRGYNSAVTMKPTNAAAGDDSELAGSSKSIIDGAPPDAVTTDAGGNKVLKDTETYTGTTNDAAIAYYNSAVGNTKAYVRHDDDKAVRTTEDNSLTVTFGAA